MRDLISRQAAIEAIASRDETNGTVKVFTGREVNGILADIPPAQQWIPCSERLPEKDGRYLVTCSKIGSWEVDWNIWHNEPKPSWLWEQGVTAWMSLPKPYKGEEE